RALDPLRRAGLGAEGASSGARNSGDEAPSLRTTRQPLRHLWTAPHALEPPNASSGRAREWRIERRSRSLALLRRVPRQRASGASKRAVGKRRDHSDRCERRAAREAGVAGGSPRQEPQREPAASHALAPSSGVLQHLGNDRKERTQGL